MPDLFVLLYSGDPEVVHNCRIAGQPLARWLFMDSPLPSVIPSVVPTLLDLRKELGGLRARCRAAAQRGRCRRDLAIPRGFRLERFLSATRDAMVLAAARAHSHTAVGASALGVPERTYRRWLDLLPMPVPRAQHATRLSTRPWLAWIGDQQPPTAFREAAERALVGLNSVGPGRVHPGEFDDSGLLGAVIDVEGAPAAIDAFVVRAHARFLPMVLRGSPNGPAALLLSRLGIASQFLDPEASAAVIGDLVSAGHVASRLAGDFASCRFSFDGRSPRWLLRATKVLRGVDADILLLADARCSTKAAAARAIGLPFRTFYRRLGRVRRAT
jgi:hypothetical protein